MSSLNKEEIVLLNCFSYLDIRNLIDIKLGKAVGDIIKDTGQFEELTADKPALIGQESWRKILELIQNNKKLSSLIITAQSKEMNYDTKGLNATCFLDKSSNEATFVFRGTGSGEWVDNGVAFSEPDSPQQLEALEYFERSLKRYKLLEKNYSINVTGHSKGGNKAQFITIHSDIVGECYSFDGQGFSKEALEQYKNKIEQNQHKITSITADLDYVHCLGNEIAGKKELFKTKYNLLEYPKNHCPDAILNKDGQLTEKVQNEPWQNVMINKYTRYLMELKPSMKKEIFSSFMGLAQMSLGGEPAIEKRVPSFNDAKIAISSASTEYKNWFSQDRNEFTFGQKLVLSALGMPILKLGVQFCYYLEYKSFAKLEEMVFGTLSKDIKKEFSNSQDIIELQKVLELSKKDLENVHKLIVEKIEKETTNIPSLTKSLESNEACNSTLTIEKNRALILEASRHIKRIANDIMQIENKKEELNKIRINLETVDKNRNIAQNYDNKILFKKSYQDKFQNEKNSFDMAQSYLKSVGISNWDEYNKFAEEFNKSNCVLDSLKSEMNKLKLIQDNLRKEVIKKENIQKRMLKEHGVANKSQNYPKSKNSKMQIEI